MSYAEVFKQSLIMGAGVFGVLTVCNVTAYRLKNWIRPVDLKIERPDDTIHINLNHIHHHEYHSNLQRVESKNQLGGVSHAP